MRFNPLNYIAEISAGVLLSIAAAQVGEAGDTGHGNGEYVFDRPNFGCNVEHPPEGTVIDGQLTLERGIPVAVGNGDTYSYYSCWFNASQVAELPSDTIMYGVSPYDAPDSGSVLSVLNSITPDPGTDE